MSKIVLPIDSSLTNIGQLFRCSQNLIISASPGSGKTTRIPPALLEWTQGQILVLEPRRVAALAAATRIAEENQWTLGQEVGYQVRFENRSSAQTRLKFLTEALLVRQMLGDPELKGVDVVVLDEFHERSSHVDLALGLLRELQQMGHPIKLIVMSATLESEKISAYLGMAPVIEVPGQFFELSKIHDSKPQHLRLGADFYQRLQSRVQEIISQTKKDVLVFLPGVGEIRRAEEVLSPWAGPRNIEIQTLFAQKPLSDQREILKKTSARQRVILSTNLAESALTIEGVGAVIDSGLERRVEFNEKTETERISLQRISKASAIQREGRAARQFPGLCFKLWTKSDELSFPPQIPAEILKIDLSASLLFLSAQGVLDFENFSWFERPPLRNIQWASQELRALEALDSENRITPLGRQILRFPVAPRLAKLLVLSQAHGVFPQACELVALLHEKDILSSPLQQAEKKLFESDLLERWSLWNEGSPLISRQNQEQVEKVAKSLEALGSIPHSVGGAHPLPSHQKIEILQKLLAQSFLDRLCRRRAPGSDRALRCGGRGVILSSDSIVKTSPLFIPLKSIDILGQNETNVSWAHGLSFGQLEAWFPQHISKQTRVCFDLQRQRVVRETQTCFQAFLPSFLQSYLPSETEALPGFSTLPLDEPTITEASPQEVQEQLPQVILNAWPSLIKQNSTLAHWMSRYEAFVESLGSDDSEVLNWRLSPTILKVLSEELALGHSQLKEIQALDVPAFIENHMSQELKAYLQKEWPLFWLAPNGRRLPIKYSPTQSPSVEIKIQELFGLCEHPKMFGQDRPLVIHLLAPSQRPVQITSDILGFWTGSYKDVKKELKARYPKHRWPEDPSKELPDLPRPPRKKESP